MSEHTATEYRYMAEERLNYSNLAAVGPGVMRDERQLAQLYATLAVAKGLEERALVKVGECTCDAWAGDPRPGAHAYNCPLSMSHAPGCMCDSCEARS